MRGTRRSIWLLIAMVALLMLALGTAASAQVQDGPTPPELGDPVDGSGNVAPHGGYSGATDFCLQCHEVHDATGAYALMAEASVTATCQTCHSIGGTGGTTAIDPGYPSSDNPAVAGTIGTVSARTVYDYTVPIGGPGAAHTIGYGAGQGWVTDSGWTMGSYPPATPSEDAATEGASGVAGGGIYCGSCHTPHGDFGQLVNNWVASDSGSKQVYWTDPTDPTGQTHELRTLYLNGSSWEVCAGPGQTNCAWATELDAEGQEVSLFGYKLLSAYPQHQYAATPQSYNTTLNNNDSGDWCMVCHDHDFPAGSHNHGGGCVGCHGNPVNPSLGDTTDFPHSSSADTFLVDYPDALCIACHTTGSLP